MVVGLSGCRAVGLLVCVAHHTDLSSFIQSCTSLIDAATSSSSRLIIPRTCRSNTSDFDAASTASLPRIYKYSEREKTRRSGAG